MFEIKPNEVPSIRIAKAIGNKTTNKVLFYVEGGLGDQVCAEPTMRYAVLNFPEIEFSIYSAYSELFEHLKFKNVFRPSDKVFEDQFLVIRTYANGFANEWFNANMMNGVDFASVSALRMQLPPEYKRLQLSIRKPAPDLEKLMKYDSIVIHPGKTWESRTFPGEWWMDVVEMALSVNRPVIILGNQTVDMEIHKSAIDLRGKLNLNDYAWFCANAHKVVTNDTSALHLAAAGKPTIAFGATVRAPWHLYHYRYGTFGQGMYSFTVKNMWEEFKSFPNNLDPVDCTRVPKGNSINEYLPDPKKMSYWLAG